MRIACKQFCTANNYTFFGDNFKMQGDQFDVEFKKSDVDSEKSVVDFEKSDVDFEKSEVDFAGGGSSRGAYPLSGRRPPKKINNEPHHL